MGSREVGSGVRGGGVVELGGKTKGIREKYNEAVRYAGMQQHTGVSIQSLYINLVKIPQTCQMNHYT